jgi:tRNA(fMet)-specific endonuclease VapC
MILLDTDHLTVLRYPEHAQFASLTRRMTATAGEQFAATVVSVEEQLRGWLAEVNRHQDLRKQIPAYDRLATLFTFFARWQIIRFDERAAEEFERLRKQKVRIGTMDLKIAAIALTHDALLSANLRDFRQVPGLRVENWLLD